MKIVIANLIHYKVSITDDNKSFSGRSYQTLGCFHDDEIPFAKDNYIKFLNNRNLESLNDKSMNYYFININEVESFSEEAINDSGYASFVDELDDNM